jgi:hypothetical protein
MSKNEILQNNTAEKELRTIEDSVDIIATANGKLNRSLFFIFNLVRLFAFGLRLVVLFFMGHSVFS